MNISIDDHPLLDAVLLYTRWPTALEHVETLPALDEWFSMEATSPLVAVDDIKTQIRNLLRHGGFKPSGRSKPASEYLVSAVQKSRLGSINPAVDCCNVASLHSGLPISVVDIGRGKGPWRIGIADVGSEYVFNPTGQVISIGGLVVLFDAEGPCGGPVKDSQRTKTHDQTLQTLSVVWGTKSLPDRSMQCAEWYAELNRSLGADVQIVRPTAPTSPLG